MARTKKPLLFLAALMIVAGVVSAQSGSLTTDSEAGSSDSSRISFLKLDTSVQANLSVMNQFLSVNASAAYRFGFLGLGAGVKTFFGLSLPENRVSPYARLELGRFYLGAGPSIAAPQASVEGGYASIGTSVFLTGGFAPTFVDLGPGRLGMDASIDFLPTSHEVVVVDVPQDQGFFAYLIASIVANAAANVGVFIVNTVKLSIGATYSIAL